MAAEALFAFSLFLAVYPYLIYPLFVRGLARVAGKPWRKGGRRPSVSLIISVFNEEGVIRKKIENALSLRYPRSRLEVVVVSDGSNDGTNAIAASFKDRRLTLRLFAERAGKTACLNRAVPAARGDIVIFTDANAIFPPDLVENLVANFVDPAVGLVTGWTRYGGEGRGGSTGLYGRLEKATKEAESLVASCVGADGAVFAMRKDLFSPLRDADINDFVIPLQVIGQGKRAVLDPEVYCFEEPSGEGRSEFRRQARITNRTLGAIRRNGRFLNPLRFGWFAFFLLSHKLLRFLVPFFLAGTFILSLCLAGSSYLFTAIAFAHLLFVGLGAVALGGRRGGRVGQLCSYFLLTISAQLIGWIRWATGRSDVIWTPQR